MCRLFLNVVVARWPRGMSVVKPGSHCPKCGHILPWWQNLPIISYLALRARCAFVQGLYLSQVCGFGVCMWGLVGSPDLSIWRCVGDPPLVLDRVLLCGDCESGPQSLVDP